MLAARQGKNSVSHVMLGPTLSTQACHSFNLTHKHLLPHTHMAAMGSEQKQKGQKVPAVGFSLLDDLLLDRIAEALISQLSPLWDRRNLLSQAANLACVGNPRTTRMAQELFQSLSPHLGGATREQESCPACLQRAAGQTPVRRLAGA